MADEIPRYFLLRSDSHYIVAQALVSMEQATLIAAVQTEIKAKFEGPARLPAIEAVELPALPPASPGGGAAERDRAMLAAMGVMIFGDGDTN